MDEYADCDPELRSKIIFPALIQNDGFLVLIGTPRGHNHFYTEWTRAKTDPAWFTMMLKASNTGLIPPHQMEQARKELSADEYEQEMECSFEAAIKGAFYATEMARAQTEGRIGNVPYDRAARVHTGWDLGKVDATAIWFIQVVGKEFHIIDYEESSGVDISYYVKLMEQRGYIWGNHYFPHDIAQRHLGMEHSRIEQFSSLGIEPVYNPAPGNVLDGISAVRHLLDRCWFDERKCARGLDALKTYRREWDQRLNDWRQNPLHDWSSHGADALRTFATQWQDERPKIEVKWRGRAGGAWMAT